MPPGRVVVVGEHAPKVVVDLQLATRSELEFCREQQKQSSAPNQRSLTDILVEHSFITANQAKRIRSQLDERRKGQFPGYDFICNDQGTDCNTITANKTYLVANDGSGSEAFPAETVEHRRCRRGRA